MGETTPDSTIRVPTISFVTSNGKHSEIVYAVDRFNIGIRYGNFYARRLSEHLRLDPEQGVIRISMVHYNTQEEIHALIDVLGSLLA